MTLLFKKKTWDLSILKFIPSCQGEGQPGHLIPRYPASRRITWDLCFPAASGSAPLVALEQYQGGGIRVACRSAGWYPQPQVLWRDSHGRHLPSHSESVTQDESGLFAAESSIILTRGPYQNLSCAIRHALQSQERGSPFYISGERRTRAVPSQRSRWSCVWQAPPAENLRCLLLSASSAFGSGVWAGVLPKFTGSVSTKCGFGGGGAGRGGKGNPHCSRISADSGVKYKRSEHWNQTKKEKPTHALRLTCCEILSYWFGMRNKLPCLILASTYIEYSLFFPCQTAKLLFFYWKIDLGWGICQNRDAMVNWTNHTQNRPAGSRAFQLYPAPFLLWE